MEFSFELAREYVDHIIKEFKLDPEWKYCIKKGKQFGDNEKIKYCDVIWSRPTQKSPIPRATAVLHFKIDTTMQDVEITYRIEENRLVFHPETDTFKEQWLTDLIENKMKLRELIPFLAEDSTRHVLHPILLSEKDVDYS
eukprot:Nk52_evm5s710 gene=Nk52_evmTU5s710